ncbi:hypothetical protein C8Q73DRAFT_151359 [Cubamyces lactineus]|nr:hypothetical protein C8Q73DRAFT_151359 [Cubamyces lactineus]
MRRPKHLVVLVQVVPPSGSRSSATARAIWVLSRITSSSLITMCTPPAELCDGKMQGAPTSPSSQSARACSKCACPLSVSPCGTATATRARQRGPRSAERRADPLKACAVRPPAGASAATSADADTNKTRTTRSSSAPSRAPARPAGTGEVLSSKLSMHPERQRALARPVVDRAEGEVLRLRVELDRRPRGTFVRSSALKFIVTYGRGSRRSFWLRETSWTRSDANWAHINI